MTSVVIAWLLAGVWARFVSDVAIRRLLLVPATTLGLAGQIQVLVSDLQKAVVAANHRDFLYQYCQLLKLAGNWLWRQLQLLLVQILIGGSIYLVVRAGLQSQTTDWQLGAYAGDILFLVGALLGVPLGALGSTAWRRCRT